MPDYARNVKPVNTEISFVIDEAQEASIRKEIHVPFVFGVGVVPNKLKLLEYESAQILTFVYRLVSVDRFNLKEDVWPDRLWNGKIELNYRLCEIKVPVKGVESDGAKS